MPRRTRRLVAVLVAGLALVAVAGPVAAAAPQAVSITSHMTFPGDGPNYGDFSVDGGGGLMCASGRVEDTGYVFGGYQSDRKLQILVLKDFICADGSGIIHVKIQVHVVFGVGETFTWIVEGGTGPYANLHGSGQGTTIPNADPSTGNTNIYDGFLVG
ncbi:MAG TPA: hypothetical protein VLA23_04675 [Candidatus Limnocylindrales bacterium]|nr:hypothetical protein [Candidatus Limnocylindrales bacterium]